MGNLLNFTPADYQKAKGLCKLRAPTRAGKVLSKHALCGKASEFRPAAGARRMFAHYVGRAGTGPLGRVTQELAIPGSAQSSPALQPP